MIIAAGGTGGHLYPGVALAREFERQMPGSEAIFVGTTRGLETKVVPREGFELITIAARGVMGKGAGGALQGLAVVPLGVAQCLAVCRKRRPDLAIGVGGYTSPPLILAAFLLGIKRVIVEPNVYPGVANRVLSPIANLIFVSFADTAAYFGSRKTRIVGTPIRREFLEAPILSGGEGAGSETRGFTLLILGGSQGARSINRALVAALPALVAAHPGLRVIHQTGERDYEEVAAAYRAFSGGRQVGTGGAREPVAPENATGGGPPPVEMEAVPFLYDMPRAFRQADLIVSRSGATTVAEITACGKPAVLIPFPHAVHGHQERNARVLERAGAAHVIVDARLSDDVLAGAILALLARPDRLREMERCSKSLGQGDAAERIVSECRALVKR
ncbi:MAG: UDP-N-acetylglucosamine--N-acetylmuramyl-(pentapeptide) pyrophosphoryl-undecaprenol N-acetylglucosamine transferase [Nitrospirae bacterium]|nr:UDP-N-acetylglucosamine--N-acetylmuramyl-(pentapeptide) pyrophosphoryl-undecaprenol N-acetylglucosamine transferase [Nitrospirota bacterium]